MPAAAGARACGATAWWSARIARWRRTFVDLADKVAVVTGGASGIGLGAARALARAGCDVVLADVNEARLRDARVGIEALGRRALAVRCDVAVDADVERLREVVL